jgi:hypothetical protein
MHRSVGKKISIKIVGSTAFVKTIHYNAQQSEDKNDPITIIHEKYLVKK